MRAHISKFTFRRQYGVTEYNGLKNALPFILIIAIAALFPAVSTAYALSVDLTVKESAGVAATNEPITVVVPLPEGAFQSPDRFGITGPSGAPVVAQFSPLNRWWLKDKSIRNLLVSFMADVSAGGSSVYRLNDANTVPTSDTTLKVVGGSDVITVSTGPMRFTVKKTGGGIYDQVWLDLNNNGMFESGETMLSPLSDQGGVLTNIDGTTTLLCSSPQNAVSVIEESGPVRAVIRIETNTEALPGNLFGYRARIYAYCGRSDIRIDFTLKNAVPAKTGRILYFDDFSLKFKPAISTGATVTFGGSTLHSGTIGSGSALLQSSADAYSLNGSVTGSGARAAGWVDVSNASKGMTVSIAKFWQQFPKGLDIDAAGALYARLWPRGEQDSSGIYWLGDMQYKTHSVYFNFHGAGESPATWTQRSALIDRRPVATVPLVWYRETRMPTDLLGIIPLQSAVAEPYWGFYGTPDSLGWRNFGNNGRKYTPTTGGSPREWRGDGFMVSGNTAWLYCTEHWARHSADIRPTHIDGYKHPMIAQWGNFVPGGYAWSNWRENGPAYEHGASFDGWYPYDDQHAWIHEMEDAYYYSGDRLLYDNLIILGELFKTPLLRSDRPGADAQANGRCLGWKFELVRIAATISGDTGSYAMLSHIANALCDTILDQVYGPNVAGDQSFMQGILFQHLLSFYRELPPGATRSRLFGALCGLGDYISYHCWAADNRGVGQMIGTKATPYYANTDMGDAVAMMYYLTGMPEYKQKTAIIANLGSFWTNWRGANAGKAVMYVLNTSRADTVPPAAIADVRAYYTGRTNDMVLLKWTVPVGAMRYDIRSSIRTIVKRMDSDLTATSENWWHCTPHYIPQPASAAGTRQQALITGSNLRNRNFVIRSFDATGDEANLSEFSNSARPDSLFDPDTVTAVSNWKNLEKSAEARIRISRKGMSGYLEVEMNHLQRVVVSDMLGRAMCDVPISGGNSAKIYTGRLTIGTYLLRAEYDRKSIVRRIMVMR